MKKVFLPFLIAIMVEFVTLCPIQAEIHEGLVAYYPFQNNAYDASGHGNHGVVYGATLTTDRFGRAKNAYAFDGHDDYIRIPDSPTLNPHHAMTISCWILVNEHRKSYGQAHNIIVKDDFNHSLRDFLLSVNTTVQWVVFAPDNTPGIVRGGVIKTGTWHHLVGLYDGTSSHLYVDGTHVSHTRWEAPIHDTETPLLIGHTNDTRYHRAFDGKIDDIRIYNRALREEEIQELYRDVAVEGQLSDVDLDGVIDLWDHCPDTRANSYVDRHGCSQKEQVKDSRSLSEKPAPDLLVNGDFEAGNTGFTTEFRYTPGEELSDERMYAVVSNPNQVHRAASSYFDHTFGDGHGLMMVLNGAINSGQLIWSQTLNVGPHQLYEFEFWYSTWYPRSPAGIAVEINGIIISPPLFAPLNTGVWQSFKTQWYSGNKTIATIRLLNTTTEEVGNDFAIDDLSFTAAEKAN